MFVKQIQVGHMLNYAYIVADREGGEGLVIDPSWEPEKIYEEAKSAGVIIKYIINTHCHDDHVNGSNRMKELTGARLAIHESEAKYLKHFYQIDTDIRLKEGDVLFVGELQVKVMHAPGHSPGSICLLAGDSLFTGDTLFVGGGGRVDLPGGDMDQFCRTMEMLKGLEDSVKVFPGHNYGDVPVSTIGEERRNNPCMNST